MKWYNTNGLKILYDAEYSGDYLTGRKFGLYSGASDKIRGNYKIEIDTANPNSPNSRINCRTLEFFVIFEADDYDGGSGYHQIFNSSGDIDDSDQVGDIDTYKWYLKSEEYNSQYVFANYPLLIFKTSLQEQTTDFFPITMSFIKKSSSQWDEQNDPALWVRIPIDSIYFNDGCFGGQDAFQLGGSWLVYNFVGRISSEESEDYDTYTNLDYYNDLSSGLMKHAQFEDDDMEYCDFNMTTDTYSITNKSYPESYPNLTTFRGMTITVTTEETEDENGYPAVKIIFYCNGRVIYKHLVPTGGSSSNYGYIQLPRYIANQTTSERYGYWAFDINRDEKICQPLFIRAYDRTLTPEQIQNNTDIDRQRFIGDMNMGWINNTPPPEGFPS